MSTLSEPVGTARPGWGRYHLAMAWILRHERALYLACVAALVVPVWLFTYFPSTDGPVHLNIAQILRDYDNPAAELYRRYFVLNPYIEPNVTAHYALAELSRVMDMLVAEKVLLTVILLTFAAGARCASGAVSPSAAPMAFLFLPTAYSYFFNEGYYNFCLGLGLYLLVFGYWYPRRNMLTWRRAAVLVVLGIAVVWTHLIALAMLAFTVGVVTTVEYGLRWLEAGKGDDRRRTALGYAGRAALMLLVFAPAMAFAVSFFLRYGVSEPPAMEQDYFRRLKHLLSMSYLFTHSPWEVAILSPFLGLLLVLGGRRLIDLVRRRTLGRGDAFLALGVLLAIAYMILPVTTKGVEITQRFLPYILFALMLWTISRPASPRLAATTIGLIVLVLSGSTVYHLYKFDQYNRLIDEYASAAAHVEPHSTVLALHFWRQDMPLRGERITWRSDPLRHIASHIARTTDGVDLRSYMMSIGYFPVRYRDEMDPYLQLGRDLEKVPPQVDLTPSGGKPRIDYIIAFAYPDGTADRETRQVMDRILAHHELVYVSPSNGLVRLYRRRDGG